MHWIIDLLRGRCPVCRRGPVFASLWRMYPDCPHCATHFEREEGFFAMSMFVGEVLAVAAGAPFFLLALWLDLPLSGLIAVPVIAIILLTPLIFRCGRLVWLYIDQWLDPRPGSLR